MNARKHTDVKCIAIARSPTEGTRWVAVVRAAMAALLLIAICAVPASAQEVQVGSLVSVETGQQQTSPHPGKIDLTGVWRFSGDWLENGLAEGWHQPEFDDSEWRSLHVPGSWEDQGITTNNPRWPSTKPSDGYNGYAWYRRHFTVPAEWEHARVAFRSGEIHDMDWVYVNGQLIGSTTTDDPWTQERDYTIPPDLLKAGDDNAIAVRICDLAGAGGLYEGPVELVRVDLEPSVAKPTAPSTGAGRYKRTQDEIVRVGSDVTVGYDERVEGNIVVVGGSANIRGYVDGDVVAVGGSIKAYSGSHIGGDAVVIGGAVERDDDAVIAGDIVTVLPGVLWKHGRLKGEFVPRYAGPWSFFIRLLIRLLTWAVLGVLAVLIFRQRLELMAKALPLYSGRAAVYGIAGLAISPAALLTVVIAAVMVAVLLAITVVGILLIPAVGAAVLALASGLALLFVLGVAAVWLSLGRAVAGQFGRADMNALSAVLIGVLLVTLAASSVPAVGYLVTVTVIIFGFGLALMTGAGSSPDWLHQRLGLARRLGKRAAPETPAPEPSGQSEAAPEAPANEPQPTEDDKDPSAG